jgi:hypothetical protein
LFVVARLAVGLVEFETECTEAAKVAKELVDYLKETVNTVTKAVNSERSSASRAEKSK